MIRLTFEKGVQEKAVCVCTDSDISFRMNQAPFENRGIRFSGSALLFDGYSVWFEDAGERLKRKGDFSVSFLLAPYGYSDRGDGLFSLFDGERKEGFYVLITKQGKLQAGFGNGRMLFSFDSLEVRADLNAWNMVTVVYGQEAGWCDLYVNGSLANRKQFPRHMEIKWPEGRAYLGRYVDHVVCTEESPSGCFYGLMEELLLWGKALRADEVKELHNVRPTGETAEKLGLDRSVYEGDAQHPQYHLIPPGKWMNEPHGPLYYQGYYHIFYQANPHAPIWDHIQWGHMVSRDMVHWEDMPLALETDETLDPDGCWSGSSLVDKEGRPCIFYTAGNDRCFPNQFVAMAEAVIDGEKRLPVWKKCDRPAVTQTQGWLGEFRDPFVWLEDDTYFMLVGTGDADNGGGNAVLYSSDDRESWQCHGFFLDYDYGKNREAGHVFELPVLLPLKGEEGDVVCHIFLFCACQIEGDVVETYGFLGKWDPKGRSFLKFHEKAMLLDLGNGSFTGPSGFVTPDGRTVVFTIAQGKRGWKEEYYAGWAHNGGLPVELSVQNSELRIRPIRELSSLRRRELLRLADVSLEEAKEALAAFSGNMLWLRIRADARLLQVEAGDAQTKRIIYYDREAERFGVFDETGEELGKYRGEEDRVELGDELVCMEYFLDHSMIEAYLNEKKSITARNYIAGRNRRISLDGSVDRICELELWEMSPAYEK